MNAAALISMVGLSLATSQPGQRAATVQFVDSGALVAEESTLIIDGTPRHARRTDSEPRSDGSVTRLRIDGAPSSSTITVKNGAMCGVIIDENGDAYAVASRGSDGYTAARIETATAGCKVLRGDARRATNSLQILPSATTSLRRRAVVPPPVTIDVMEIYGTAFLLAVGGPEEAEVMIQNAVDVTNTALRDSGDPGIQLRLVRTEFSTRYPNQVVDDTSAFEYDGDMLAERQAFGADLVGFFVGRITGAVGLGYRPTYFTDPSLGFHWVAGSFFDTAFTFAHEVGHNLGGDHEPPEAEPSSSDPFPFARAYTLPKVWRSILAQGTTCSCDGHFLYSNPSVTYLGGPAGIPDQVDNARVFRLLAPRVAQYYPAVDLSRAAAPCEFVMTPPSASLPAEGGSVSVTITRTRGSCADVPASLSPWVTLPPSPPSTGVLTLNVAANTSIARKTFIAVYHTLFAITQAEAPNSNLLRNGGFDRDLSGWGKAHDWEVGSTAWNPIDHAGDPKSGSALLRIDDGATAYGISQCVPVVGGATYDMSANVMVPSRQPYTGSADWMMNDVMDLEIPTYVSTDCSGQALNASQGYAWLSPISTDRWFPVKTSVAVTATARSANVIISIFLFNRKPPFSFQVDNVAFAKR